jgi:hypothetical protein
MNFYLKENRTSITCQTDVEASSASLRRPHHKLADLRAQFHFPFKIRALTCPKQTHKTGDSRSAFLLAARASRLRALAQLSHTTETYPYKNCISLEFRSLLRPRIFIFPIRRGVKTSALCFKETNDECAYSASLKRL